MKAIIFDFDGTLANTLPVCFHAFQQVFKKYDQRELTNEDVKAMFGPSETGIIQTNLQHSSIVEAIEDYYIHYLEDHEAAVPSNQEILHMLSRLKDAGYRLGIFTGKASRSLEISLEALNMKQFFDVMITGDDVQKPKPDPEGLHLAMELLGVSKAETMFVGDSDADILAGNKAGVFTVGVHWLPEYHSAEFAVIPNRLIKSVQEFMDMLLNEYSV